MAGAALSAVPALLSGGAYQTYDAIRSASGSGADEKTAFDTRVPQTKTDRGSQLPLVLGRHLLAPVFGGDLGTREQVETSSVQGAKGGIGAASGADNTVYYGRCIQLYGVGPGRRLRSLEKNGEIVWPRPGEFPDGITPDTHPSGSRLTCAGSPSEGSFVIYWGERDQPENLAMTRTGQFPVETNLPFVCYIYWDELRLGATEVYPNVLADIEFAPYKSANLFGTSYLALPSELGLGEPWFRNGFAIDEAACGDALIYDESLGQIKVSGDLTPVDYFALRYTNADTIISRALASSYDALEKIQQPATLRLSAITRDDWSTTFTNAFCSWTPVAGPTVPGVVNDPAIFEIATLNTSATGSNRWLTTFGPLAASPVPPGGGVFNDAGSGYVVVQCYMNADAVTGTTSFDILFNNESNVANPTLNAAIGSVIVSPGSVTVLGNSGVDFSIERRFVGNGWYEVVARARVLGNNALAPADPYFFALSGLFTRGNGLIVAGGTGDSPSLAPALLSTSSVFEYTGITTVSTSLDLRSFQDFTGEMCKYEPNADGGDHGANAAHVIYQLMFEQAPHGLGLDETQYRIETLQAAAVELTTEGLRSHISVQDNRSVADALSALLLDLAVEITWDPSVGKMRFDVRRDRGPIAIVPRDMLVSAPIELTRKLEAGVAEKVSYAFTSASDGFTEQTIGLSKSGDAQTGGYAGVSPSRVESSRDVETGQKLALLRASTDLSLPNLVTMNLTRDAIALRTPDVIDIEPVSGLKGKFRIVTVQGSPKTSEVVVKAYADTVKFPDFTLGSSFRQNFSDTDSDIEPDLAGIVVLTADGVEAYRLRVDTRATRASLTGSNDGVGYWNLGVVNNAAGGEVLDIDGTDIIFRTVRPNDVASLLAIPSSASTSEVLQGVLNTGHRFSFTELVDMGDGLWRLEGVTSSLPATADFVFLWRVGSVVEITEGIPTGPGAAYKIVPISRRKVGTPVAVSAESPIP